MRAIVAALAALGGGVILAAFVVSVARGDGSEAEWLLLGPLPFRLIGLTWWPGSCGSLPVCLRKASIALRRQMSFAFADTPGLPSESGKYRFRVATYICQ